MSCMRAKYTGSWYDGYLITEREFIAIHVDICGPMKTIYCENNGNLLMVTIVEEEYIRVSFLKSRTGIKNLLSNICNLD